MLGGNGDRRAEWWAMQFVGTMNARRGAGTPVRSAL